MRRLLLLALLLIAAPLAAQGDTKTIAPGMTRAKVVEVLGQPATVRSVAEFTYLFYTNSCAQRCGMNDLVVLRGDSVVDAIFRSPSRHYSGTSSSPAPISSSDAARAKPSAPAAAIKPATRMKPPAEANDVRPSIPVSPGTIRPAPSSSPTTSSP
jgi:outer membrane protein assembly factor BamE (lipoprotein component of BamABCDE complex)